MPRLFFGNFDFEHQLADPGHQPAHRLIRIAAERAAAWLSIADEGDYLWCPLPISPAFVEKLETLGLPRVIPVSEISQIPENVEFVPWGWTRAVFKLAQAHRWKFTAPDLSAVRAVNARQFSFGLETEWCLGLPGATAIQHTDDLSAALRRAHTYSPRVVIKANFGMSGRERILVTGALSSPQRGWIHKRLAEQGALFIEPWVERLDEVGIQLQIPARGSPELLGVTRLVCDELGQYRGSWFTTPHQSGSEFIHRWQPAIDVALRAAERMQALGYFGPVGIDAMRYRSDDGTIHLRPLQDINARWTMGRLSLGWQRFAQPGETGFWSHAANEMTLARPANAEACREVRIPALVFSEDGPAYSSRLCFTQSTQGN